MIPLISFLDIHRQIKEASAGMVMLYSMLTITYNHGLWLVTKMTREKRDVGVDCEVRSLFRPLPLPFIFCSFMIFNCNNF